MYDIHSRNLHSPHHKRHHIDDAPRQQLGNGDVLSVRLDCDEGTLSFSAVRGATQERLPIPGATYTGLDCSAGVRLAATLYDDGEALAMLSEPSPPNLGAYMSIVREACSKTGR